MSIKKVNFRGEELQVESKVWENYGKKRIYFEIGFAPCAGSASKEKNLCWDINEQAWKSCKFEWMPEDNLKWEQMRDELYRVFADEMELPQQEEAGKKIVKINKEEIKERIKFGDNCDGSPVFVVSPDGEAKTSWQPSRSFSIFSDDDIELPIPSLWPDGSGRDSEEAWQCIGRNLPIPKFSSLEKVEEYLDKEDLSPVEFCEKFLADDWGYAVEACVDWLLDNWLKAINEEPNDLYPNEDLYEEASGCGLVTRREREFHFEWAE